MEIRGIDFTVYMVSDLDKSVEFYTDTMGLKLDGKWGDTYAEFDVNGAAFGLYKAGAQPGGGQVAFNVANIAESLAELRSKGVPVVMDILETPVCRMAAISDPDGNSVMLHEKPKV